MGPFGQSQLNLSLIWAKSQRILSWISAQSELNLG